MQNQKKFPKVICAAVIIICVIVSTAVLYACLFVHSVYPNEKADELLFYLTNNSEGDGKSAVAEGVLKMGVPFLLTAALIIFVLYGRLTVKGRKILPIRFKKTFALIVCLAMIAAGLQSIGFFAYVFAETHASEMIEICYVNPAGKAKAPENKRNIIIIELESMETTLFTKEQGGDFGYEVIPELYGLLSEEDAVFFSSDRNVRGVDNLYGTTWTTAALVSYTSGLPFKVPASVNNSYHSDHFMQGAYTLGDVLLENGYENVMISGARTSFGGVKDYFTCHGKYKIIDTSTVAYYGYKIPASQENEWGFSDEASFKIARDYLENRSSDAPFHLLISTIDTHFTGYVYESDDGYTGSETKFDRKVDNAYATTSRVTGEFISWLKQQDFYSDTTVLIIGDHMNMSAYFYEGSNPESRARYNVILNSVREADNTKKRTFTPLDFYPTLLYAAGFEIEGNRLGLGVNLCSEESTLPEKYGLDYFSRQMEYGSDFYNDRILGDDWEKLRKMAEEAD